MFDVNGPRFLAIHSFIHSLHSHSFQTLLGAIHTSSFADSPFKGKTRMITSPGKNGEVPSARQYNGLEAR